MIGDILDAFAKTQDRPWSHDRSQTVGASEVGQCARKVFWLKNEGDQQYGAQRDPDHADTWGARLRGTIMENELWVPAMRQRFGERLLFAGSDQQTLVSGFISATPDGLITTLHEGEHESLLEGTCATAECKTADPRTNLSEAKAENVYQTHVQMGLIRDLTPYQPTHSILSYIDASFWNEVVEFVVPFDQRIYETGKARAAQIMTATHPSELKPEGWIAGGKDCEYCPFTKACNVERRRVPDTDILASLDSQFVAEVTDMALAIKSAESAVEIQSSTLRDLQNQLKDRLREKGIRKVPGVVSWSAVKGRSSYNNKEIQEAAKLAGINIEQYKSEGEPTDRLQITLKSEVAA